MNPLDQSGIIAHLEPIMKNNLLAAARKARLVFVQVYPGYLPTEYHLHPDWQQPPKEIDGYPVRLDPTIRPGYIRLVAPEVQ